MLDEAVRRVRLLTAVGPTATVRELVDDARRGNRLDRRASPSGVRADAEVQRVLEPIAAGRDERGGALGALSAARASELLLELDMIEHMERPGLRALARRRYLRGDGAEARADEVAVAWLAEATEPDRTALHPLDDPGDPRSLLSRLRVELARQAIPFRVTARASLAPLAATGPGEVQVARGRWASGEAIARTVCHEVRGHAAPMHRAMSEELGVYRYGSAHGADEQEGYALSWEERSGHLVGDRRRELALRHSAARAVQGGAELTELVRAAVSAGATWELAVRIGLRVTRGGGLARECVYLPSWLRVREAGDDVWWSLARGRISVAAARALGDAARLTPDA